MFKLFNNLSLNYKILIPISIMFLSTIISHFFVANNFIVFAILTICCATLTSVFINIKHFLNPMASISNIINEINNNLNIEIPNYHHRNELETIFHSLEFLKSSIIEKRIIEDELNIYKDKLDAFSKSKIEFTTAINHQIRTPISGIISGINILLESNMEKDKVQLLNMMKSAANSLLSIINNGGNGGNGKEKQIGIISEPLSIKTNFSYKILLAEDELLNRLSLSAMLRDAGHKVTTVSNGIDVLSNLKKEKYDIILMDIKMPKLDGIDTAITIRNSESGEFDRNIPIIALTAYSINDDYYNAGINDHISKPVIIAELIEKINLLINNAAKYHENR
ncbi:MAG: response regulator [Desulfobacterales bacterium]|nr:response regulator [Desulfobacterales bacterium]